MNVCFDTIWCMQPNMVKVCSTHELMLIYVYVYIHMCIYVCIHIISLDAVTESVECRLHMQKVQSSNTSRVKSMTYQIDTYRYLASHLALIG